MRVKITLIRYFYTHFRFISWLFIEVFLTSISYETSLVTDFLIYVQNRDDTEIEYAPLPQQSFSDLRTLESKDDLFS